MTDLAPITRYLNALAALYDAQEALDMTHYSLGPELEPPSCHTTEDDMREYLSPADAYYAAEYLTYGPDGPPEQPDPDKERELQEWLDRWRDADAEGDA